MQTVIYRNSLKLFCSRRLFWTYITIMRIPYQVKNLLLTTVRFRCRINHSINGLTWLTRYDMLQPMKLTNEVSLLRQMVKLVWSPLLIIVFVLFITFGIHYNEIHLPDETDSMISWKYSPHQSFFYSCLSARLDLYV